MIEKASKTKRISPVLILIYNSLLAAGLILLSPLILPLVLAKTKRRKTFFQRMGWCRYPWQDNKPGRQSRHIWVHALSVGEVMSAHTLVQQLKEHNPDAELFFTASTLTGFQTACRLFSESSVHLGYFPYDCIWAVRKVCAMIRPSHVILTETDIWPTFLWELQRRRVPVYIVNLRISDRTWNNYKRFRWLAKHVYACFDRLCVQTPREKDRLMALDVPAHRIQITGNLKFDGMDWEGGATTVSAPVGEPDIPTGHRVIVAGSTHEGEEAILFDALAPILSEDGLISLMVVPRDPGRSRDILSLCRQYSLQGHLFSGLSATRGDPFPQVVIVDSIGLLKDLYQLAYLSFVGGSMVPFGGHNPLEPAFWGKPVLFGQDMRDFGLIADYLLTGGGALLVKDAESLEYAVRQLLDNPDLAGRMGNRAMNVMKSHRGAVERTLSHLELAA